MRSRHRAGRPGTELCGSGTALCRPSAELCGSGTTLSGLGTAWAGDGAGPRDYNSQRAPARLARAPCTGRLPGARNMESERDVYRQFQDWCLRTYGDSGKTKTVTRKNTSGSSSSSTAASRAPRTTPNLNSGSNRRVSSWASRTRSAGAAAAAPSKCSTCRSRPR